MQYTEKKVIIKHLSSSLFCHPYLLNEVFNNYYKNKRDKDRISFMMSDNCPQKTYSINFYPFSSLYPQWK